MLELWCFVHHQSKVGVEEVVESSSPPNLLIHWKEVGGLVGFLVIPRPEGRKIWIFERMSTKANVSY